MNRDHKRAPVFFLANIRGSCQDFKNGAFVNFSGKYLCSDDRKRAGSIAGRDGSNNASN